MPLPFIMRHCRKWKTGSEAQMVRLALPQFDLQDDCEGILLYGRDYESDRTRLIVIPGSSLKRSGQNTRSDIVWMWRQLQVNLPPGHLRVRIGDNGYLTVLHTTEPEMYITSMNVGIADSWAESDWAWQWIRYVCAESIGAQKIGKLRVKLNDSIPMEDKLAKTLRFINELSNS